MTVRSLHTHAPAHSHDVPRGASHKAARHKAAGHAHGKRATLGMIRTPSGITVIPQAGVNRGELAQALAGIGRLPVSDQQLLVANGISIELFPVAGLEDGLLGATTIIQDDGQSQWRPTRVRIAVRSGYTGPQAIGEIVQHEIGHVISVLRGQDRSEEAAIAYAKRY